MAKQKQTPQKPLLPKNPTYVLGLDLSLNNTGYYRYNPLTKKTDFGLIKSKDLVGMSRIDNIVTNIEPLTMGSGIILLEGYSFGSKGAAAVSLGELGGVVRHFLWKNGKTYLDIPPTTAKKFLTNKGNADKSLILKEMFKLYAIDLDDDNIADACNLCQMGRSLLGEPVVRAYQESIIESILAGK